MSYSNIKRRQLINRSKSGPKVKGLQLANVKSRFSGKSPQGDTSFSSLKLAPKKKTQSKTNARGIGAALKGLGNLNIYSNKKI